MNDTLKPGDIFTINHYIFKWTVVMAENGSYRLKPHVPVEIEEEEDNDPDADLFE